MLNYIKNTEIPRFYWHSDNCEKCEHMDKDCIFNDWSEVDLKMKCPSFIRKNYSPSNEN